MLGDPQASAGALAATELLDRLLVEAPGTTVRGGCAWDLAVSDRDRLLAAIYVHTFSDQIESEVRCSACGERTTISFSLEELVASLAPDEAARREVGVSGPDDKGRFTLTEGVRFRLPTSGDQRVSLGASGDDQPQHAASVLVRRCVVAETGRTGADLDASVIERVGAAMAVVGPTVEHRFEVGCESCPAAEHVHFDIQPFLLRALAHERRYLVREVHYLASTYGWGLSEILSLPRADRRAYVELVVAERAAKRERGWR